ncbi:MAG: hypothetical protein QS98_C0009G0006 [archaeon GW2011_AR3]|nr:MAG: hypothetical protein QS98_C0009G0006 [archaeon GW2011_AR3]
MHINISKPGTSMQSKNLISKYLWHSFVLIGIILFSSPSSALSIGVTPANIDFNDMLRGGYAEKNVRISTSDARNITGHISKFGDIADWLRIEPDPESLSFSSSAPYTMKVVVEPPVDAANGVYTGEIRILTDSAGAGEGTVGSQVRASVSLEVTVRITDVELKACSAGAASLDDTEIGLPLSLEWLVRNTGNVRIAPRITIDIWDKDKQSLIASREYESAEILPTTEQGFNRKFSSEGMAVGQYWANMAIQDCDYSGLTTFDIVEKGVISDKGEILAVEAASYVYSGDIVPVTAKFMNRGIRAVTAKFKGDIRLDNKIVQLIESEVVLVEPGETVGLTSFFTPEKTGKYSVSGHVVYNNKLTFEKSTIINVNPKQKTLTIGTALLVALYLAIIITIIFLIRKIRNARKK